MPLGTKKRVMRNFVLITGRQSVIDQNATQGSETPQDWKKK
jgi:hypothetical protein